MNRILAGFALIAMLSSCASGSRVQEPIAPRYLLSNPQAFDGRSVLVRGWMESGFERYRVWQSRAAHDAGLYESECIALAIPVEMESDRFDQKDVFLRGTFIAKIDTNELVTGGCRNRATLVLRSADVPELIFEPEP